MLKRRWYLGVLAFCWAVWPLSAQNFQKGDYGYLYCHMSGRGEWTAYALSRDGLHYEDLLGGGPVYDVAELCGIEQGRVMHIYVVRMTEKVILWLLPT